MRRAARVTCKGRDPKTGYRLLLSLFCFIFRLSSCFGFLSDFWQWLPFPWCISPWLHQTVPFFLIPLFFLFFYPLHLCHKGTRKTIKKKKRGISRKPGCARCALVSCAKNYLGCVCTHTWIHTHSYCHYTIPQRCPACDEGGGINYLNLSDLPSLFLAPLSLSSNPPFCPFSFSLPSCEHTSLHLNFCHFFF